MTNKCKMTLIVKRSSALYVSIYKLIGPKYSISQMLHLGASFCLFAIVSLLINNVNFHGASSVTGDNNGLPKYVFPEAALPTQSGYFTVNHTSQARMFWVFYEALNVGRDGASVSETPIILWLQGGPGCSSMTGNFYEFGPWHIGPDNLLHKNNNTWNQKYALLFMDNPVGTGYSVVERDEDIPSDEHQVITQLFSALLLFFAANPVFKTRPFFVGGESYAGKYVPMLGHYIMGKKESSAQERDGCLSKDENLFRLDGLFIGNGLTHPVVQVQTHGNTAYQSGLIDEMQKSYVEELAKEVVTLIENENWDAAFSARTALVDWITNATGLTTLLDIRRSVPYHCSSDGTDFLARFLNQQSVKEALMANAASEWVSCNPRVRSALAGDIMRSVKWIMEELLPVIPVLLYQGIYDMKDGVACNEAWMQTLTWNGTQAFFATPRTLWRVNDEVAGYWRTYFTLSHVVLLGAGHLVPADQGLHSQKMIQRWIGEQLLLVPHA